MDNVRYARPSASDEDVREACRLANADKFVRALPQGYDKKKGNWTIGAALDYGTGKYT